MKTPFSRTLIINGYYFIFIFFIVYLFIQKARLGYYKESYQITEFLINYEGGFVRRGLFGEIILNIYNYFGIHPYLIIISTGFLSFLLLIFFFLQNFIKKGYPIFFLPLVFFLGNPIIHDFWLRKDILIILIFILTIRQTIKANKYSLIGLNLVFSTGLLIHESIAFFGFPIIFLILFSNYNSLKKTLLVLIPSLATFFLVIYNKGSVLISKKIWNSWSIIKFPFESQEKENVPAAIDALSWTLKEGLQYSYHTLRNFNDGIYAPLGWIIIILLIYYTLTNTHKFNLKLFGYKPVNQINKKNISILLVFQFLSISPLFILGWDYGRWIFLWVISSFVLYLLIPQKIISELFPEKISNYIIAWNKGLDIPLNGISILFLSLLIGFPANSWSLIGSLNSSSIVIVLRFMSKLIEYSFAIITKLQFLL